MTSTELTPTTRPLKIAYLVIGMVYIGISLTWLLDETGVIEPDGYEWLLPAILLGAGLVGLLGSLGKGFLDRRVPEPAAAPAYGDYTSTQPILDLTSDIDRKLDEEATEARDNKNGETS